MILVCHYNKNLQIMRCIQEKNIWIVMMVYKRFHVENTRVNYKKVH